MSKHTPGPWMTDGSFHGYPWTVHKTQQFDDLGPSKGMIASIQDFDGNYQTRIANARLIAAAPDLLAACRMVVMLRQLGGMLPGSRDVVQAIVEAAQAAIVKAEGEQ